MSSAWKAIEDLRDFIPLMQPSRPVLVTTRFPDGQINVAPFAWCVPVSHTPPLIGLALLRTPRRQRSLINILRDRQFVVNMPGPELAARLVAASYWYPKGVNKVKALGFETAPANAVDVPVLTECHAHIECRLAQTLETGDHTMLIADVVAATYDREVFGHNYLMDLAKTQPMLQLRHFVTSAGQVHIFYTGGQSMAYSVPFVEGGMDADGRPTGDEED